MRIISGTFGGRRLSPPKNITARPTTDFAKESLFNLLQNRMEFEGIDMLDLFAGTGGIGLEFVSRGAREVTAVELAHTQQNFIIQTCKQLGIRNLSLIRGDVFRYLNACRISYDFIYADPPYALDRLEELPDLVLPRLKRAAGLCWSMVRTAISRSTPAT
jgi:16S rRNA (guanine(966)-N(2))-methyltransferase RsmD